MGALVDAMFSHTSFRKTLCNIDIISERLICHAQLILTLSTCAVIRTSSCF